MAQDTALLRYLLKWARRAPWSWSQRDLAFEFDWTNDYISSNATIGRTGYDMNVAWNVTTGSDGDGSYFWINWNYRRDLVTWSAGNLSSASINLSQTASFSIKTRFKITSFSVDNNTTWLIWSASIIAIYLQNNVGLLTTRIRNGWTFTDATTTIATWTLYDCYLVYDQPTNKLYMYLWTSWWASTLINAWWTTVAAGTFWWSQVYNMWDLWVAWWNYTSCNKYIYHAAIRNKALTQAEIDADIALWNTAKSDPTIVAYYIPDNLQYNTQYMLDPKDLSSANRSKTWTSSVTANTTVAPDGTTTADTLQITWTATQWTRQTRTAISWSTIASKTFIVKAFVKVAAATSLFRLEMTHNNVAAYYSSDQTATTTRQEFTFTKTFTSSTSGSWITWWIVNDTWATNPTLQVRNVRVYLTNETLRDESPNIWWFIWWKTPLVMSARVKTWIDASDTFNSQVIIKAPRHYLQVRWTTNIVNRRSETTLQARIAWTGWTATLWTWNRNKVNIVVYKYRDWTGWLYEAYVNGVKTTGTTSTYSTTIRPAGTIYTTQLLVWKDNLAVYYTWDIRDARIYTFTWSFTDADVVAIYNGWEPVSAWVTKYLHYRPPVGEVWTTTQDQSTNDRDWTLNNGVTRDYI